MSSRYRSYPVLSEGRFAPITNAIGFLEAPFPLVVDIDREWRTAIGSFTQRPVQGSIDDHLAALLPLTGPVSRHVWVSTEGQWTAYFDNFRAGGDPYAPLPYLSKQLGCRGVVVAWSPQTRSAPGGARFDLYGQAPVDSLNYTRSVSAINDGGWTFSAVGTQQPFEEPDRYLAPHVRDRVTPNMLERYAAALGIRVFDAAFYSGFSVLVENVAYAGKVLEETLLQAQTRLGLLKHE